MRIVTFIFCSLFFVTGCTNFPIEVDCGVECEDGVAQPPSTQQQSATETNTTTTKTTKNDTLMIEEPEEPPQPTMYASKDWKDYAIELANKINKELVTRGYVDKSVYVKPACSDPHPCEPEVTAFDKAFRDLLITELVRLAIPTVEQHSEDTVNVSYNAQVVFHGTKEPNFIEKLYQNPRRFLADEVIITTSIVLKNSYIFRESGIYTIKDKDFWHYKDYGRKAATIKVAPKTIVSPPVNANIEKMQKLENQPTSLQQNT